MINGLHHATIATHHFDRIVGFYRDVMGFEVVMDVDWGGDARIDGMIGLKDTSGKVAMLQAGNAFLEIFEYVTPRGAAHDPERPLCDTGFTHIGLNVSDIDAEFARLSANGMRFHNPPTGEPGSGLRAVYGRDPDGNVVELVEVMARENPIFLASAPRPQSAAA